jgi:hypothetical protein
MEKFNSLSHSRYDCKYYVVFVPKFRKKLLFGKIKIKERRINMRFFNSRIFAVCSLIIMPSIFLVGQTFADDPNGNTILKTTDVVTTNKTSKTGTVNNGNKVLLAQATKENSDIITKTASNKKNSGPQFDAPYLALGRMNNEKWAIEDK